MPVQLTYPFQKFDEENFLYNHFGYTQWKFPGGEIGVRVDNFPTHTRQFTIVLHGIVTSDDIMVALNLNNALRQLRNDVSISLAMKYVPYGRQDRACANGESFALRVFASVLGTVPWAEIWIDDPHSDVTVRELDWSNVKPVVKTQQNIVKNYLYENPDITNMVLPDAGAAKKHSEPPVHWIKMFTMNKTRVGIGEIVHEAPEKDIIVGQCVVVDDICDGGATFLSVAKTLRETQPRMTMLSLYVTHGIFSKGLDKLLNVYDNIGCYNVMSTDESVLKYFAKTGG